MKTRGILFSGLLWIIIALGIGPVGLSLVDSKGVLAVVGWVVAIAAFAFAGLSFKHLYAVIRTRNVAAMQGVQATRHPGEGVTPSATPDVGRFFYRLNYSRHYSDFLKGALNPQRATAELFLFRAWTTQFGFRVFSSDADMSEVLIAEVINQAKYLGKEVLREIDGTDVEEDLGGRFIDLLDERWRAYDQAFLQHKDAEPPIPTRAICAKATDYCGVSDPIKFVWLCQDFIAQLEAIKRESVKAGLLLVPR